MATGAAFWPTQQHCLDEAFDAPDTEADYELCRAIAAGKMGLHPDAWGNHDPLPLRWLLRRRRVEPAPQEREYQYKYEASEVDPAWEAEHRRRPVEESPIKPAKRKPAKRKPVPWVPPWSWVPRQPAPWEGGYTGEIQLTCDDCKGRFHTTLSYRYGKREERAARLRALAATKNWTHIGRDRCPLCSLMVAPRIVDNNPLDVDPQL